MRHPTLVAIAIALCGASCSSPGDAPHPQLSDTAETGTRPIPTPPWQDAFDFDGDGMRDHVQITYTGGAHCCYRIAVSLPIGKLVDLPFDIDGGYVRGLDLSQPDQFNVLVGADGRAEFQMEIATYNGEPQPIPPEWTKQFRVRSHRIAVRFSAGEPSIKNLGWRCEQAMMAIKRQAWTAWEGLPKDCTLQKMMDDLTAAKVSEQPTFLRSQQRPGMLVRLELGSRPTPPLDVTLEEGRVVELSVAGSADVDPTILAKAFGETAQKWHNKNFVGYAEWVWPERGVSVRTDPHGTVVGLTLLPAVSTAD